MLEMTSSIEIETPEIETHETIDPQPTFPAQMPTPRPTATGEKRTAVVLSPLTNACENNEEMVKVIKATMQKTVESTIKVSLDNSMPNFIAKIQDEVQKNHGDCNRQRSCKNEDRATGRAGAKN